MNKKIFILPGFFSTTGETGYQKIAKEFCKYEFDVIFVDIAWKYNRINDYISQFLESYQRYKGTSNYIFGFSYGALIAYMSAKDHINNIDGLYLASIAPYFKEDLPYIPEGEKSEIGNRRFDDIEKTLFLEDSEKLLDVNLNVFYGSLEQDFVKRRSLLFKETYPKAIVSEINGVGHDINNPNYFEYLRKEITSQYSTC